MYFLDFYGGGESCCYKVDCLASNRDDMPAFAVSASDVDVSPNSHNLGKDSALLVNFDMDEGLPVTGPAAHTEQGALRAGAAQL